MSFPLSPERVLSLACTLPVAVLTYGVAWGAAQKRGLDLALHPVVAIATLIGVGVLGALTAVSDARAFELVALFPSLAMIAYIDGRWMRIFAESTYWALALVVVATIVTRQDLRTALYGCACTTLIFAAFWFCTRGKFLGLGDVRLAPTIGWSLGLFMLPAFAYITAIVGGVVGMALFLRGRRGEMAFGPILAAGVVATVYIGPAFLSSTAGIL